MIPQAILFDFDGVLGRTMEDNYTAWAHALENTCGVALGQQEYFLLEGLSVHKVAVTLLEKHGRDPQLAQQMAQAKEDHYRRHNRFAFYPHARELIQQLVSKGLPLGLVTGANEGRLAQSVDSTFLDLFKTIVTGDKVDRPKPDPQPYLRAAQELDVPPMNCLVVENAPLGIRAAKQANMFCLAVTTTLSAQYLTEADAIVSDLATVGRTLKKMLS